MAFPGVDIPATGRLAALFRVPINYVLEVRVLGKIVGAVSVPNYPGGLVFEQPHASSVRHTFGDKPVREGTKNKARRIIISGDSGYKARAGYNALGQVIFANGPTIVREFQAFLDAYQENFANYPDRVDLIFRAFDDDLNYKCEVDAWNTTRDAAQSAATGMWSLVLKAYGDAPPNNPINLLSPVSEWFEEAAAAIQLANAYVAIAGNATTNLRGDLESLRAPLQALQQTGQALQTVTQGARAVARFPADMVADFANAAVAFKGAWEDVTGGRFDDPLGVNGWNALDGEWELLQTRLGYSAEDSVRDSTTVLGYSGGSATDLAASQARAGSVGPLDGLHRRTESRGLRRDARETTLVQLRPREDLRDLALRFYGDASRWIEIAEYNGWQNAHRLGSGRPSRRGDWVHVPRREIRPLLLAESDPYLEDVFLDGEGDVVFVGQDDPTGFKMDLRTIRGPDNLRQALTGRLTTVLGESRGFPLYGLPRAVGKGLSAGTAAYVSGHLRDQLLRDPRVDSVVNLSVSDEGDKLVAEGDITAKDSAGSPVHLLAPLPSAA